MCRSCNETFDNDGVQREHYRSEWHRYNLKRKVAGLPGVTAAWFEIRRKTLEAQSAVVERQLYVCVACDKEYSSAKAHANHLQSRAHQTRAAVVQDKGPVNAPVLRPRVVTGRGALLPGTLVRGQSESAGTAELKDRNVSMLDEDDDDDEDWEEMDEDEAAALVAEDGDVLPSQEAEAEAGELEEWDSARCLFCDWRARQGDEAECAECVEHMHRQHGFFVPDAEYLAKPRELLQYLGLKVSFPVSTHVEIHFQLHFLWTLAQGMVGADSRISGVLLCFRGAAGFQGLHVSTLRREGPAVRKSGSRPQAHGGQKPLQVALGRRLGCSRRGVGRVL